MTSSNQQNYHNVAIKVRGVEHISKIVWFDIQSMVNVWTVGTFKNAEKKLTIAQGNAQEVTQAYSVGENN